MSANMHASNPVQVVVAEDRLKAWVTLRGQGSPGFTPPTLEEVVEALARARLVVNEVVQARVTELLAQAAQPAGTPSADGPSAPPEPFLVAEGQPPANAEDGQFEWAPELARFFAPPAENEQIDYFTRTEIVTVAAQAAIGRIVAPKDGTPGVDVHGHPRPPRKPKGVPIALGAGVRLAAEGAAEVVAEREGRVALEHGQLRIDEVLEIRGDVDLSTGSVASCVDVNVRGAVRANFKVHTTASLQVGKVIEAADISTGRDVTVRGGIFGHNRAGKVVAGGSVTAQLLSEVDLQAGGDVRFQKELLNCRLRANGRLIGESGTVIGGDTYARAGVTVRVLGSDAGVLTSVAVGTDVNDLRRVRQLERQIKDATKSADQIRDTVKPLLANMKRLSPAQRERATELLSKADEIESHVDGLREQSDRLLKEGAPPEAPCLLVGEVVYPGVHVTIDARESRLQKPLHGPVRIEMRKVENVTEMVAVNQRTGSVSVLPSTDVDLDVPPADERNKCEKKVGAHESTVDNRRA